MQWQARHPSSLFQELGSDVFRMIRTEAGLGDDGFRRLYLPSAERLALVVQEAPLQKEAFPYRLGALRYGLMAGAMAIRLSSSTIFRNGITAKERADLTPQYRWCAYIATLTCVPIIVLNGQEIVVSESLWSPWDSSKTLYEASLAGNGYRVAWLPQSDSLGKPPASLGIAVSSSFFYPGLLAGLERGVLRDFCAAINPSLQRPPVESPLAVVVRRAQELVLAAEAQRVAKEIANGNSTVLTVADLQLEEQTSQVGNAPGPAPVPDKNRDAPKEASQKVPIAEQATSKAAQVKEQTKQKSTEKNESTTISKPVFVKPDEDGVISPVVKSTTDNNSVAENSISQAVVPEIPGQISAWIRAVSAHAPLRKHIVLLANGDVQIHKQALAYGQPATKTYTELHDAGYVVLKMTDGAIFNSVIAAEFKKNLPS